MAKSSLAPALPSLIEEVYDCVADGSRWTDMLRHASAMFNGVIGLVAIADTVAGRARFSAAFGDEAVLAPLLEQGAAGLPFYGAITRLEIDVPVTVDMLYDIQGPGARDSWLNSPINLEWAVPNRLDDFYWVALMKQPTRVGSFIVITSLDHPQIGDDELRAFAELAPHMRRAVTIGDLFETERQNAAAFSAIVGALAHPVFVVSATMRVLWANPAADVFFNASTAVSVAKGHLAFQWSRAEAAISSAVILGTRDECALGPSGINVPLSSTHTPAIAHILPLARRDRQARIVNEAAAAIFIAEAGTVPLSAMDAIAALFGLTAAEKRVAAQVARGLSRTEIAEANAVADATVKSQLSAIYEKTDTADQRQFASLVRDLTPPVADS